MIDAPELLRAYLRTIRTAASAVSVTLYVPAPLSGLAHALVVHEGDGPPLPELENLEAAQEFAERGESVMRTSPHLVTSASPAGRLLALPHREEAGHPSNEAAINDVERRNEEPARRTAWLGLRFPDSATRFDVHDVSADLWPPLIALGGALSSHAREVSIILKDPLTGLPDRAEFQALLAEAFDGFLIRGAPVSLLFINPDRFADVNQSLGRSAGDRALVEIGQRLSREVRRSNSLARYGGVTFAVILPETTVELADELAATLLSTLTEGAYLEGALRLGFSIGVGSTTPLGDSMHKPLHLIRRADKALHAAKTQGGGGFVNWSSDSKEESGTFDRLVGMFTGNVRKDYRNMVLLWETVNVIAVNDDPEITVARVVRSLYSTFKPECVGLVEVVEGSERATMRGLSRTSSVPTDDTQLEMLAISARQTDLVKAALAAGEPRHEARHTATEALLSYAIPLVAGDVDNVCLYIEGFEGVKGLDSSDVFFLKALGKQLAVALDRGRLAALENERRAHDERRLRAELNELREAVQQAKLIYRSESMESLLAKVRTVAPTDATVLITGESGTGKELLAHTVHKLSSRRASPMVLVDCGSITASLIESELFGHEKGAFTGADQARTGRLAEADGGTVFLDEIGELPLAVQSKLLRFVQEKLFTPVGGTREQQVEVRIIAATNRDLAEDVSVGRFREDLFHRLNVITLVLPALRDRSADILPLAHHFLETFSIQYQKDVHSFTVEAERLLLQYAWPGNVRELQNRLMQAVLLCRGEKLQPEDLQLEQPMVRDVPSPTATDSELWSELRAALARQMVEALASAESAARQPLGRWLSDDLLLEAHAAAGGSGRRAAALVGLPPSSFQRRVSKAAQREKEGLAHRATEWGEVRRILSELIVEATADGEDLLERAEEILLDEIRKHAPDDVQTGAALLGVTPPTFRRRLRERD